ncbi:MAG TPA: biotin/lipoyl-containing protein, partial [Solirubrobacteraceae bacterium]
MAVNTTVQVTLPQMGESVTEGTVLEWHKQEGERVEADEVLVEISTDKVDAEVPSPATGTVVKIHVAEGDTVSVGAVLAEIATENGAGPAAASGNGDAPAPEASAPATPEAAAPATGDGGDAPAADAPATSDGGGAPAAATPNGPAPEAAAPAATESAPPTGDVVDIVTPTGGESVTEGTILEWAVKVGDAVEDGQTVVELSTDKVDMELPAPAAGTITEILAEEGDTVTVGQVIARMQTGAAAPPPAAPEQSSGNGAAAPEAPAADSPEKISPVAARIAAAEGVDLSAITGTGPGGRITKADVLDAKNGAPAPAPSAAPAPAAPEAQAAGQRTLMKGGAAMLARYMDESRSIPTATSFRTITVTTMDGRRKQLKAAGEKVSFTHLIAYAIALAAEQDMPVMAHHFAQEDGKAFRVDDGQVNLGIAVDVEKKDGSRTLMVPVILDAGRKSFADFKAAFDALIEKARTNTLTADDLAHANITLTNPGGIGTIASVPRLMVGQGTIVATGAISYPPGLQAIGEAVGAEKVMTMTSTYDHRIIQGAESGRFLQVVEAYLNGENAFYDGVFASLGAQLGPPPAAPQPQVAAPAAAAPAPAAAPDEDLLQAVQAATSLLKAHRTHGHLAARLDPLGTEPEGDPALEPTTVALTPEIMARIPAKILRMYVPGATLAEALPHLRETYCGTIAYEIEHIASHRQRMWLREKIESSEFRQPLSADEQKALLQRLVEVDALERFMHKAYLGQKQFSIEGLDMTVPML